MEKIYLGIVDDEPIRRLGIATQFKQSTKIILSFELNTTREVSGACRKRVPDVIIAVKESAFTNQLLLLQDIKLRFANVKVLLLMHHCSFEEMKLSQEAGMDGVIISTCAPDELVTGVDFVLNCGNYFHPCERQKWLVRSEEDMLKYDHWCKVLLSEREADVLKLLSEGLVSKQIADILDIAECTVRDHRDHLLQKTKCHNAADLTVFAFNIGWIKPLHPDLINSKNIHIPKPPPPIGFSDGSAWFY